MPWLLRANLSGCGHVKKGVTKTDGQLLTLSHTSIDYITKRTQFEQTSHVIPTTLISNKAAPKAEYQSGSHEVLSLMSRQGLPRIANEAGLTADAIQTFAADIVKRSKDIELLIAALPKVTDSTDRVSFAPSIHHKLTSRSSG
jgi:hypothetical protein